MKLYAKDSRSKLRVWEIVQTDLCGFTITSGLAAGAQTSKFVSVIAKANRTIDEQIALEMHSRVKRKLDAGFTESMSDALHVERTNGLGFLRPMLAKPKVTEYDRVNSHVQIKYDGLRCLIKNIAGINYAYSKSGILYPEITHILQGVRIPEGATIDGELYCHGVSLQKINSWVKKGQEDTNKLTYHCYDEISEDAFSVRLERLHSYSLGNSAVVVPTWLAKDINITEKMQEVRSQGYEGLIIRQPDYGYQSGKRNNAMLKVKQFLSAEYNVTDIIESKDGMARLVLLTDSGKAFKVFAPGTHEEKTEVLNNSQNYIGKQVEIEYANLSDDGIPIQPVAKGFRDYE